MSRWIVVAALALAGCMESRIKDAEKRAAEAEQAAGRFESEQIKPIERAVLGLRDEVSRRTQETAAAQNQLRTLHERLVTLWAGDPAKMRQQASDAAVPKDLAEPLERAQQTAGQTANERKFAEAVERVSYAELAKLIERREEGAGFNVESDTAPGSLSTAPSPDCEREPVKLRCAPLASEDRGSKRLLCRSESPGETYVAGLEDARLAVRRLVPDAGGGEVRLLRALGRDFWLVRKDFKEPVSARSADTNAEVTARTWLTFLQLSASAATERLALAVPEKLKTSQVDLDGDGIDELLLISPGSVRAAHYDRKARDVSLWTIEETCRAPKAAGKVGEAQAACQEAEKQAQQRAAAAAALSEKIAQAPPPGRTLEQLRDAVARCEVAAAKKTLSKAFAAKLLDDLKSRNKTEEEAFRQLCDDARQRPEVLQGMKLGAASISGDRAKVDVTFDQRTDTASLVFEDGAWRLLLDEPLP